MSCCQNCTRRTLGCHDKCEDYLNYKKELSEKNKQKKRVKNSLYGSYLYNAKYRMHKFRCTNGITKSGR